MRKGYAKGRNEQGVVASSAPAHGQQEHLRMLAGERRRTRCSTDWVNGDRMISK